MVNDLAQISQFSDLSSNLFQEFQSSTMINNPIQSSKSSIIPVPRLIEYRFFSITPVSENPPSFSWPAFTGVSRYIVQLSDSKGIVWREKVEVGNNCDTNKPKSSKNSNTKEKVEIVTYQSEKSLEPGRDYIFTVEIAPNNSHVDYSFVQDNKIANDVKDGVITIKKKDLPEQFKISLIAQLDGLLIARQEILEIIQGTIRQGSSSEIIYFLANFLDQASGFQLLAQAGSSDDILDALAEIASQLAAANITLSKYLELSGVQTALVKSIVSKSKNLALFRKNLEGAFQLIQVGQSIFSSSCKSCEDAILSCINNGGNPRDCKDIVCSHSDCLGCSICV